ncbi:MAG: YIP1 family protein [Lachnospiraceae bacterium]|nr:YIP1 family protein [Lachnospiraceae bacterium]
MNQSFIKKNRFIILVLALLLVLDMTSYSVARAQQATSYTYAEDEDGYWVRTQDAYLPYLTVTDLSLSGAEEMFIDANDILYIADTGNKRIILFDLNQGQVINEIKAPVMSSPRGVYVTKNGKIYVADTGAKAVLIFNNDLSFERAIYKPDSPMFADTNYEPKRIAVDDAGNIFLVGEGVYNGIIQLASTGEFLGYFAVNDANLTIAQRIQRALFTREQLANLIDANPTVFTNVFVDKDGIVYTATSGMNHNGMKKHATNGGNMFVDDVYSNPELIDVYVDNQGMIYTASVGGYISVYSKNGEEVFSFGSAVRTQDIAGLFTRLSSVAVDSKGYIWAMDATKGYIQGFKPTEYASLVYSAMNLYEEGHYEASMEKWNEVLKLNQMSVLAHNGVGKAYLHAENYEKAMEHFEVANNKGMYSEAFWEVRNDYIQDYLTAGLIIIVVLLIANAVLKGFDKKYGKYTALKGKVSEKLKNTKVIRDFYWAFKTNRKPFDHYYEIKKNRQGSLLGATSIYLVFFIVFMWYQAGKGFIYQYTDIEDMDITSIVAGFFAILILFIVGNYLVTSITDGDGTLKQVYMIPAYGLMPAMVSLIAVTLVSHVLTYNESFLLTLALMVGIAWSAVTIFIGLMTVHDYTFKETVKSFIITLAFMFIFAVVLIIISIMSESLFSFFGSIGKEVFWQ